MTLNRAVALATAALTLVLAVVPVVGNFDWTSTAGILAGIIAVAGIAVKWLEGWQRYEERIDDADPNITRVPQAAHTNLADG